MQRVKTAEVVQGLLSLFDNPTYLEIGVLHGKTFDQISANRKVAVDPKFRFDVEQARKANTNATYHEVTSDVYFGTIIDSQTLFDVIYLDGLHTVEQTLRDFTNALHFLSPSGVVLIDDVVPSSYEASLRGRRVAEIVRMATRPRGRGWMGDVYRLVFFIDTFFQQMSFCTVEENHGQLVTWRARRPSVQDRTIEEIGRLPYENVVLEAASFKRKPFDAILTDLRRR